MNEIKRVSGLVEGEFVKVPSVGFTGMVVNVEHVRRRSAVRVGIVNVTLQRSPEAPERTFRLCADRIAIVL